jgi:hypothetical protein
MASSLDILKSLSSNADNPTNPIQVELAQRARLDEMKRNLGMVSDTTGGMDRWGNPTGTSFSTGATIPEARSLSEDVSMAPYTGDAAQKTQTDAAVASRPDMQQMAATDFAKKMGLATAPAQAKAAGDVAVEKEKNAGLKDVLGMKQAATEKLIGSTQEPGSNNPQMRMSGINAEGSPSFAAVQDPQQVKAQAAAAQKGLAQIPQTRQIVESALQRGLTGPIAGRKNSALVASGLDSWLMNPQDATTFNDLKTQLSLTKSNLAYAHGAARGGASPAIQQRFDALLNEHMSPESLRGGLDAAERWLTAYAHAKNSSELDAADAALGIGASASPTPAPQGDLGKDW